MHCKPTLGPGADTASDDWRRRRMRAVVQSPDSRPICLGSVDCLKYAPFFPMSMLRMYVCLSASAAVAADHVLLSSHKQAQRKCCSSHTVPHGFLFSFELLSLAAAALASSESHMASPASSQHVDLAGDQGLDAARGIPTNLQAGRNMNEVLHQLLKAAKLSQTSPRLHRRRRDEPWRHVKEATAS